MFLVISSSTAKEAASGKSPGSDSGVLGNSLNRKLFDLPHLSPAHALPRTGILHSHTVRHFWRLWSEKLSTGGRFFFLASVLFFLFGIVSLELQALIPVGYALAIWFLAILVSFFEKPAFALQTPRESRVPVGSPLDLPVKITQQSKSQNAGAVIIPHRLPIHFQIEPVLGALIPPLANGESLAINFRLTPTKRGVYHLRGFRLETDFPFGLVNASRVINCGDVVTVYPRFDPLERINVPMGRKYQPGGVAFTSPHADSVEYVGNRDYREGDDIRHIDWRATARLNNLIVREYREEYFLRAAVVLDTHIPRPTPAALEDFERAVSLCAACSDAMNRREYLVDILAAGPDLYHLLAGRGTNSLNQILDILACVEPTSDAPWDRLSPSLWQNLQQITSVVCIFLDWDSKRRDFATRLVESGVAVKIILVRDKESTGPPLFNPAADWNGEVLTLGTREFTAGIQEV